MWPHCPTEGLGVLGAPALTAEQGVLEVAPSTGKVDEGKQHSKEQHSCQQQWVAVGQEGGVRQGGAPCPPCASFPPSSSLIIQLRGNEKTDGADLSEECKEVVGKSVPSSVLPSQGNLISGGGYGSAPATSASRAAQLKALWRFSPQPLTPAPKRRNRSAAHCAQRHRRVPTAHPVGNCRHSPRDPRPVCFVPGRGTGMGWGGYGMGVTAPLSGAGVVLITPPPAHSEHPKPTDTHGKKKSTAKQSNDLTVRA